MIKYKLLFVDHAPFVGGAQLALLRHIRYLKKSDVSVVIVSSVLTPELSQKYRLLADRVYFLSFSQLKVVRPLSLWRLIRTSLHIIAIVRRERSDLVITNTERAFYPTLLAAKICRKKVVALIRDYEYSGLLLNLLRPLVDQYVFVSKDLQEHYLKESRAKSQIVYVGTDFVLSPGSVTTQLDLRKTVRQSWGVQSQRQVVCGFAGRLVDWKGAQVLVKAAVALSQRKFRPDGWRVVVAGTGNGQEGDNGYALSAMIKKAGLNEEVLLLGFIEKMTNFYSGLDIFVHPSIKPEPFATVIIEAMAYGLPVVASESGGTSEVVIQGENGFLFPPGDSERLADYLQELIADIALRRQMGQAARTTVENNFTEELISGELLKIYRRLIEG